MEDSSVKNLDFHSLRSLHKTLIGCDDPDIVKDVLENYTKIVSTQFEKKLIQQNYEEILALVQPFLVHMHLKNRTMESLDRRLYYDYMAGLVSCYIDIRLKLQKLLIANNRESEDKLKLISSISTLVHTIFGNSKGHILDTLLQLQTKAVTKRRYLTRILTRLSKDDTFISTPEKYMKIIILYKHWLKSAQEEQKHKLIRLAMKIKVPNELTNWLKEKKMKKIVDKIDSCPLKSKTRVLLSRKFSHKLCKKFLDSLCKYRVESTDLTVFPEPLLFEMGKRKSNEEKDDINKVQQSLLFITDKGRNEMKELSQVNNSMLFFTDTGDKQRKNEETVSEEDTNEDLTNLIENMEENDISEDENEDLITENSDKSEEKHSSKSKLESIKRISNKNINLESTSENSDESESENEENNMAEKYKSVDLSDDGSDDTDDLIEESPSKVHSGSKSNGNGTVKEMNRSEIGSSDLSSTISMSTDKKEADESSFRLRLSFTDSETESICDSVEKIMINESGKKKSMEIENRKEENTEIESDKEENIEIESRKTKKKKKLATPNARLFKKPLSSSTPFFDSNSNSNSNVKNKSLTNLVSLKLPVVKLIDIRKQLGDESRIQLSVTESDKEARIEEYKRKEKLEVEEPPLLEKDVEELEIGNERITRSKRKLRSRNEKNTKNLSYGSEEFMSIKKRRIGRNSSVISSPQIEIIRKDKAVKEIDDVLKDKGFSKLRIRIVRNVEDMFSDNFSKDEIAICKPMTDPTDLKETLRIVKIALNSEDIATNKFLNDNEIVDDSDTDVSLNLNAISNAYESDLETDEFELETPSRLSRRRSSRIAATGRTVDENESLKKYDLRERNLKPKYAETKAET